MDEPGTLVGFEFLKHGDVNAATRGETGQCARRLTVRVESGREGRAATLDGLIRLVVSDGWNQHGEATRRAVGLRIQRIERDAVLFEAFDDALGEGFGETIECLWWQLLGADLDQQCGRFVIRAHADSPRLRSPGKPSFSRCAKYASATARASVRTRRM